MCLLSLKVAVFTSTRHRHHYVNIHLQNIIAIQDPLSNLFTMPSLSEGHPQQTMSISILQSIENEMSAYEDSSNTNNETFHIFSPTDNDNSDQPPLKKMNTNLKTSSNSAFNRINPKPKSSLPSSSSKFKETMGPKPQSIVKPPIQQSNKSTSNTNKIASTAVTITPPASTADTDLLKMVEKPIDADINLDGKFFMTCFNTQLI